MLSATRILSLFDKLNEALRREGEIGEIGIVGGAVMCIVHGAREATRDVAAIFAPASTIRKLAEQIARDETCRPTGSTTQRKALYTAASNVKPCSTSRT